MKYDAVSFSWAGDKYLGRSYKEMDCQAFVEKCMSDVGLHMDLGGSNSWFREIMKHGWTGTPEECMKTFGQIPKGAMLFIWEPVSANTPEKFRKDGIGDITHMGIKTGRNDGAIHSSSSRGCVATSVFKDKTIKNGGWNRIGLYEKFTYGKSIDWYLEHGGGAAPDDPDEKKEEEVVPLQGKVTAPKGSTVNLRKSKDGPLLERILVGTPVTVVDYGPEWCKIIVGGLTGWMKTEFIDFQGEVVPGDEEPIAPDPTDIEDDDDFVPGDGSEEYGPGDLVQLQLSYEDCANAYAFLKTLCDQIEKKVGRG